MVSLSLLSTLGKFGTLVIIIHVLVIFSLMSLLTFANLSLLSFFVSWKSFTTISWQFCHSCHFLFVGKFSISTFVILSLSFFANMPPSSGVSQASVRCLCLGTVRPPRPPRPSSPPPTTPVTTSRLTKIQNKKKTKT